MYHSMKIDCCNRYESSCSEHERCDVVAVAPCACSQPLEVLSKHYIVWCMGVLLHLGSMPNDIRSLGLINGLYRWMVQDI